MLKSLMGKHNDIPQDLIERAIAELNREIPSRNVLLENLGKYGPDVEAFVNRLEEIDFFAHVGEPIQHPGTAKIERVRDWEAAISASLEKDSSTLIDGIFKTQRTLIEEHDRQDLSDIAFDLYNEYAPLSIPREVRGTVKGAVFADIQGALDELILQDISDNRFFLSLFVWYERGHWPCSIKEDGTVVIF